MEVNKKEALSSREKGIGLRVGGDRRRWSANCLKVHFAKSAAVSVSSKVQMGCRVEEPRQMVRGASWIGAGRGAHVAWRKPVNQDCCQNKHPECKRPYLGNSWIGLGGFGI